jgi:hypothetical protein
MMRSSPPRKNNSCVFAEKAGNLPPAVEIFHLPPGKRPHIHLVRTAFVRGVGDELAIGREGRNHLDEQLGQEGLRLPRLRTFWIAQIERHRPDVG